MFNVASCLIDHGYTTCCCNRFTATDIIPKTSGKREDEIHVSSVRSMDNFSKKKLDWSCSTKYKSINPVLLHKNKIETSHVQKCTPLSMVAKLVHWTPKIRISLYWVLSFRENWKKWSMDVRSPILCAFSKGIKCIIWLDQ